MLAHDWFDGFRGLGGVVEGDGADVVVENVSLDDFVEENSADESHFSVDGCCCSADVVPGFAGVVRKCWVGVLEESDCDYHLLVKASYKSLSWIHTEPVVNPEIWNEIPDEHVLESISLAEFIQGAGNDSNTEITQ